MKSMKSSGTKNATKEEHLLQIRQDTVSPECVERKSGGFDGANQHSSSEVISEGISALRKVN